MRIARDPRLFSFMFGLRAGLPDRARRCAPDARGRAGSAIDLIVLDAFSSDAIPVHLLTREALAGYLARLDAGGVLVLHISNRHMELGQRGRRGRRRRAVSSPV